MGTRFELVLADGEDPARLRAIGEAALEEIRVAHDLLTRFTPGSLLARLSICPAGRGVSLDRDTFQLFVDAVQVWTSSGGAFDPALGTGMAAIHLDAAHQSLTLDHQGVRLDFGAIAKGHALDLATRVLRSGGIVAAFLHGGTSSVVGLGAPAGRPGWPVRLASLSAPGSTSSGTDAAATTAGTPGTDPAIGVTTADLPVVLMNQALSVSAAWTGNPHPTVDPRTGAAVPVPRRAVVVGPTARLADAWSTALLVLGERPAVLGSEWETRLDA